MSEARLFYALFPWVVRYAASRNSRKRTAACGCADEICGRKRRT